MNVILPRHDRHERPSGCAPNAGEAARARDQVADDGMSVPLAARPDALTHPASMGRASRLGIVCEAGKLVELGDLLVTVDEP